MRARLVSGVIAVTVALAPAMGGAYETEPTDAPLNSGLTDDDLQPLRVSMEFQDANLKDVLKIFSQQTGINVIAGEGVGDQPVTLYLADVSPLDALDQILRAGSLTYERPVGSEIYIVRPRSDKQSTTVTRVYRLKYARVSTSVLAKAAAAFGAKTPFEALEAPKAGDDQGGGGGSSSAGGGGGATDKEVGIDIVIKELLSDQGSVVVDGRTNSLIITDVPENFPRLEAVLNSLDIRTAQIIVDAEIVETALTKLKDLGFEWGTGSEGEFFTLTPGTRSTRFPFGSLPERIQPPASGGTVQSRFTVSTLSATSARMVLQALQTDSDTKILARPKVLTLDNESAVIRLTTDQAIGFSSTSVATAGTTTSTPERQTTGVILVVTPQVNEQGYITMLVEPSVTKVVSAEVQPPNSSTVVDPKTRSSRSMVRIKSGDTLVVGGLIDRSETDTFRNVPVVGDIPFLGKVFQNKEKNHSATELVVFVTPRILEEAGSSRTASAGSDLSKLREQEPAGKRQDLIEQSLNRLEDSAL